MPRLLVCSSPERRVRECDVPTEKSMTYGRAGRTPSSKSFTTAGNNSSSTFGYSCAEAMNCRGAWSHHGFERRRRNLPRRIKCPFSRPLNHARESMTDSRAFCTMKLCIEYTRLAHSFFHQFRAEKRTGNFCCIRANSVLSGQRHKDCASSNQNCVTACRFIRVRP